MSGLVDFLRARLAEDEQRARHGYYSDTHWERFTTTAHLHAWKAWREHFPRDQWDAKANDAISEAARNGIRERIAAHEKDRSARVLAEVEAKRSVLARHHAAPVPPGNEWAEEYPYCAAHGYTAPDGTVIYPVELKNCPELRDLATPYGRHPDYREEWRP